MALTREKKMKPLKITTRESDKLAADIEGAANRVDWATHHAKLNPNSADQAAYREQKITHLGELREQSLIALEARNADFESALLAVNGKSESFAITQYYEIIDVCQQIEQHLDARGVSKSAMAGTTAFYTPAGPSANAYKYAANSTRISLKRIADGWRLTAIDKTKVYPKQPERLDITIGEKTQSAIMRRAFDKITVRAEAERT